MEACIAQHLHGEFAAFVDLAVLGGDRRLTNPRLQTLHRFVVPLFDLFEHRVKIGLCGWCQLSCRESSGGRGRAPDKSSSGYGAESIAKVENLSSRIAD